MELPHHCSDSLFVVTKDAGARVSGLRSIGLKTPNANDPIFEEFSSGLTDYIGRILPKVKVITYDMVELANEVWAQAMCLKTELASNTVVSTCAELATSRRGHIIELNRIVDQNGSIIGFGPRPGADPICKQISGIAEFARGKSIVIAEDGAFSGKTIEFLVKQFARRQVEVAAVVVGVCFPSAVSQLNGSLSGKLVVVEEAEKPFEWMPDHDFLPFVPNCGRVFGSMFGGEGMPLYTHDGVSFCFPYILPFGDPVEWASIPKEHAVDFSIFCLQQALKIWKCLDELNGKRLTILDLLKMTPRVSMPMSIGDDALPTIDTPISSFLSEVCHEF